MLRLAPVIILSELTPHVTTYRKALFIMRTLFLITTGETNDEMFSNWRFFRVSWASSIAFRAHAAVFLVLIDTFGQCCGSVLVACAFCGLCILGRGPDGVSVARDGFTTWRFLFHRPNVDTMLIFWVECNRYPHNPPSKNNCAWPEEDFIVLNKHKRENCWHTVRV